MILKDSVMSGRPKVETLSKEEIEKREGDRSDRFGVYVVKQQDSPRQQALHRKSHDKLVEAILTFLTVRLHWEEVKGSKRKRRFPQS